MPKNVTTSTSTTATAPGCETTTLEELVVEWQPPPVPVEEAAGSVASWPLTVSRLAYGTASAHDLAQASSGR